MQTTNPKIKMNMKKLVLGAAMLLLAQVGFGQAVSESAIIPVSVTLNAVSRLNVESGGNIKFVFTSIADYESGFSGEHSDLYKTTVSIASSRNFSVKMYSETDNFLPTDNPSNSIEIGQLEYMLEWGGGAGSEPGTFTTAWTSVENDSNTEIIESSSGQAGSGENNRFDILWRIGTGEGTYDTFLDQGDIAPDHYVANIFIELTE